MISKQERGIDYAMYEMRRNRRKFMLFSCKGFQQISLTILRSTDTMVTEVIRMYLKKILSEKNMSQYMLSKRSGVPQSTISEICSGKAKIEKCSADTLYKISKTLNVTMESLIESEIKAHNEPYRTSFEVFKSNICHLVKDKGDMDFVLDILTTDEIRTLYNRKWYAESFYLLAMVDYLSHENDVPLCTKYNDIRRCKMQETLYPASVVILDAAFNTERQRQESLSKAIPEFLRFNIVECEVQNVY